MSRSVQAALVFFVMFAAVITVVILFGQTADDAARTTIDPKIDQAIEDASRRSVEDMVQEARDAVASREADRTPEPPPESRDQDVTKPESSDPPTPEQTPPGDGESDRSSAGQDDAEEKSLGSILGGLLETADEVGKSVIEDLEPTVLPPPSTKRRSDIGRHVHEQIMMEATRSPNQAATDHLLRLGSEVLNEVRQIHGEGFSGLDYTFTLIESPVVNAFAHVGGYVYVNTALLDLLTNDDQLRFVLAHEIGHVECCHTCGGVASGDLAESILGEGAAEIGHVLYGALSMNYSSAKELEADAFGYYVSRQLGIPATEMKAVFTLLDSLGPPEEPPAKDDPVAVIVSAVEDHFRSHPRGSARRKAIDKLENEE